MIARVRTRIVPIAREEAVRAQDPDATSRLQAKFEMVEKQIKTAARNMALAADEAQRAAMADVFDELARERNALLSELASLERREAEFDVDAEVDAAMAQLEHLENLARDPECLPAITELFEALNVNLFLGFEDAKWGKRTVRRVAGGLLTTGLAPFPIQPYEGRTSWREVKPRAKKSRKRKPVTVEEGEDSTSPPSSRSGKKADPLRNVGRGERI